MNEGQLPTGARGPGVWGGVQAGSLCRVRLWEMRAFPADRGPPGLSSGGDFVSFPAPPRRGHPASLQLRGLPGEAAGPSLHSWVSAEDPGMFPRPRSLF